MIGLYLEACRRPMLTLAKLLEDKKDFAIKSYDKKKCKATNAFFGE